MHLATLGIWITPPRTFENWWMCEEARLMPWLWLDLLNDCMTLPRGTSWVDHLLFYPPPGKHGLRPMPMAYSLRALQGRIAERDQKRQGDPRWDFLANIFIPHIEEKRWQLQYWRPEDLAALDRETEAEPAQHGPYSGRQAAPRAPASGRRRRSLLLRSVPGRSTGLRWVPKVAIQCIQGTSVPEAQEVDAEHDFKFGPKDVLIPEDYERLKE